MPHAFDKHLPNKDSETEERPLTPNDTARVQAYLQSKFNNNLFRLVRRPQAPDSVEVFLGDEFIGVLFRDDEDGDVSYDFNMAILEIDLPE